MTDQVEVDSDVYPTFPARAPGMDDRAFTKACAEHEKAGAAWFERHPEKGYRSSTRVPDVGEAPVQPSGPQPNKDDLAQLHALQARAMKGPMNPQLNQLIFNGYVQVQEGKRLDMDAIEEQWSKATETAEDREVAKAIDAFTPLIASDGSAEGGQIPAQLRSGYDLPTGQRFAVEETLRLLSTAKQLGLTQDQVDKFIELQDAE